MIKKVIILIITCLFLINNVNSQIFDSITYYNKYSPKQLCEDVDFLFKKIEEIHPNYFLETPKNKVIESYSDLKSKITKPMTRLDFMNLFSPVVFDVIKDGHNYVNIPEEDLKLFFDNGGKLFPIPVIMADRKLYVNSAISEIPYNSEILTINSENSKDIIEKILRSYNAESDNFEEVVNSDWFNSLYWANYGGSEIYNIRYISSQDSSVNEIEITGKIQSELDSLRNSHNIENYLFREFSDLKTGVIEYNQCEGLDNFISFCDSIFLIMKQKNYENLIIDIRENVGGTSRLNDVLFEYITDKPVSQFELMETKISNDKKIDFVKSNRYYAGWFKWYNYLYYPIYIRTNEYRKRIMTSKNGTINTLKIEPVKPDENPLLFKGDIYLLTGEKTYSAAACLAAAFKCYNLGEIIGQETGEPTSFTANWIGVILPNTKIMYSISSEKYTLPCSKNDGKGVIPDYIIENKNDNTGFIDLEMNYTKNLILNKTN